MILAAEQSTENLTGAFFLILVMIGMSFLAGFGLCYMLVHRRRRGAASLPGHPAGASDHAPGYGDPQ